MVSGRIAAKVIQAATTALLAREDTSHVVGSSKGFKHVSTIRLLSREDWNWVSAEHLAFFGSDWFFNDYMEWNLELRVATTFGDALGMQEMGQIFHINQISSNKNNSDSW